MIKNVVVVDPQWNHETLRATCVMNDQSGLRADTVIIDTHGQVFLEINEWGFGGPAIDPARRKAVVWGDSVVFGYGQGWVSLMDRGDRDGAWQFLNGGLPGDATAGIVDRAARDNGRFDIAANIFFPGWHPSSSEGPTNTDLERQLERLAKAVPNVVLCTMPTPLDEHVVGRDISGCIGNMTSEAIPPVPFLDFVRRYRENVFFFWGSFDYSRERCANIYRNLLERNELIRRFAEKSGMPLVDMFAAMRTTSDQDFRTYFYDVCHPRPSSYEKLAGALYAEVNTFLGQLPCR
jgi:hypothetical protein